MRAPTIARGSTHYEREQAATLEPAQEQALKREQGGVGLLRAPGAVVPPGRHPLGDQRQEGGDPRLASGHAGRFIGGRPPRPPADPADGEVSAPPIATSLRSLPSLSAARLRIQHSKCPGPSDLNASPLGERPPSLRGGRGGDDPPRSRRARVMFPVAPRPEGQNGAAGVTIPGRRRPLTRRADAATSPQGERFGERSPALPATNHEPWRGEGASPPLVRAGARSC